MGSGKPSKHVQSPKNTGRGKVLGAPTAGSSAAFPPQPPYSGPPVLYKHVTINAPMDINTRLSFFQPADISITSTNIETYYPLLASMYSEGFRMLVFVVLPGSVHTFGLSQMGQAQSVMKFQGIFRQQFPDEAGQQWELRVEKSMLVNQMFYQWRGIVTVQSGSESVSSSHHIIQTINEVTKNGGRLISVEMTGMGGQQLELQRDMMQRNNRMMTMGTGIASTIQVPVDVFYEIPHHSTSEQYVYQIVPCPMDSVFEQKFPMGRFHSTINWQGVMQEYMGVGWKLVEIFEDCSASTQSQVQGFSVNMSIKKNCLFIFEKPVSRLNDNTPYYEGTMVEHWFTTKSQIHGLGFGGSSVNVTTDWEPIIEHMGNYGWQVVRILSTPDFQMQGGLSTTIRTRQLIFFQKRLRDDAGQGLNMPPLGLNKGSEAEEGPPQPPGYEQLYPAIVSEK